MDFGLIILMGIVPMGADIWHHRIARWLQEMGATGDLDLMASRIEGLAALGVVAVATFLIVKLLIVLLVHFLAPRLPSNSLLVLAVRHRVFVARPRLFPVIAVCLANQWVFADDEPMRRFLEVVLGLILTWILALMLMRFLDAMHHRIRADQRAGHKALKSLVQAGKVLVAVAAVLATLAVALHESPMLILSGFGAATAVLLLVFKDPILGLVAGVQINANNMVEIGDWIELPDGSANGTVTDVALTTITVENFDKTNSYLPPYELISKPFINWRNMSDSGGRRIKRHLLLDLRSVRFADDSLLSHLKKVALLAPYLEERLREISEFNTNFDGDTTHPANGRRLTNIGLFRNYVIAYLKFRADVHHDNFTFLVRHLQPAEQGLPVEVYVFTTTTDWAEYEEIQADIFDHLIAVLPSFGLRPFQNLSGSDVIQAGKDMSKASDRVP